MSNAQTQIEYVQRKRGIYRTSYNLVGEMFGHVIVLEKHPQNYISPGGKHHTRWLCRCTLCGREKITTTNNLCRGGGSSCWCQAFTPEIIARRSAGLIREHAGFTEIIGSYRRNAMKRGYQFQINDEQAMKLFKGNCHYCGVEPKMIIKKSKIPFVYNGIDRTDNTIGYTTENCVSCCGVCNKAKMNLQYNDFINLIKRIHNNLSL